MTFDELKPGMVLYFNEGAFRSWIIIQRKLNNNNIVMDDYWQMDEISGDRLLVEYNRNVTRHIWNEEQFQLEYQYATYEQAKKLLVLLLTKSDML